MYTYISPKKWTILGSNERSDVAAMCMKNNNINIACLQ